MCMYADKNTTDRDAQTSYLGNLDENETKERRVSLNDKVQKGGTVQIDNRSKIIQGTEMGGKGSKKAEGSRAPSTFIFLNENVPCVIKAIMKQNHLVLKSRNIKAPTKSQDGQFTSLVYLQHSCSHAIPIAKSWKNGLNILFMARCLV